MSSENEQGGAAAAAPADTATASSMTGEEEGAAMATAATTMTTTATDTAADACQIPGAAAGVPKSTTLYIDATGQVAGRLSSKVASELLHGNRVFVFNAEKAVISGRQSSVFRQWKETLEITSRVNPINGPIHPRRPDNILRRMVRGMVPKTKSKGRIAMKHLRVYMGVPEKYSGMATTRFDDAVAHRPISVYTTLAEVAKNIGWSG